MPAESRLRRLRTAVRTAVQARVTGARWHLTHGRRSLASAVGSVWAGRAGILATAAVLGGWASLTGGIAIVVPTRAVWPISVGLLLLSASGWQFLGKIALEGLYSIHRRASKAAH